MDQFSLLSLNTFGVPFYLSIGRIKHLALELNRLAPSVLCLQEIQQNTYLPLLQQRLTSYSHFTFFRNRFAPKGGLFIATAPGCKVLQGDVFPISEPGQSIKYRNLGLGVE